MIFEKAHAELVKGKKIRRKEWEPLMHLRVLDGHVIAFRGEYTNFYDAPDFLLSDKWLVVDGDRKELTFLEALEQLRSKKCLTRDDWKEDAFLCVDNGSLAICKSGQFDFMPSFKEMGESDWEILK